MQALPHQNSTLSSTIILEVLPRPKYSIINEENYVTEVGKLSKINWLYVIMLKYSFKSHTIKPYKVESL